MIKVICITIVMILISFLCSLLIGFIVDYIGGKEETSFLASWFFSTAGMGILLTVFLYQNNYIG